MEIFITRLKKCRAEVDVSQAALAKKLGVSTSTLGNYESGIRKPDLEMLVNIANFFNVSTDYLLGLTNDPTPAAQRQQERKLIQKNQLVDIIDYGEPLDDKDLELLRLRADSALTERITELFRELFQGERNTD